MLCDPHPPRSDVPNLGMGLEESAADQPPANGAAARRSGGAGRGPAPEMLAHRRGKGQPDALAQVLGQPCRRRSRLRGAGHPCVPEPLAGGGLHAPAWHA